MLIASENETMLNNVSKKEALAFIKDPVNGVLIGDLWGYISNVNKVVTKIFGANSKSELIGKHVLIFLVEDEKGRAVKNSLDSIMKTEGKTQKYKVRLKNGEIVLLEVQTILITDRKGETSGFVDIIRKCE